MNIYKGIEMWSCTKINKYNLSKVSCLICFILIFIFFIVISNKSSAEGSGEYPAPDIGDWVIEDDTHVWNETIILNGNLIIEDGGKLKFNNVTLILNCSYDGEYFTEIKNQGIFEIYDNDNNNFTKNDASKITSKIINYAYNFYIRENADLTMKNSVISNCGFMDKNFTENWGVYINSNTVIIDKNNFTNNYAGIILESSDSVITNNSFWDNKESIICYSSNATIKNNTIMLSNKGIFCDLYSSPILKNNEIFNNIIGISCNNGSSPYIEMNDIIENELGIFCTNQSNPTIIYNDLIANEDGIICLMNSKPLIRSNQISFNKNGVFCDNNSNATIDYNNILHNQQGIYAESSSPKIENNGLSNNDQAIYCKYSSANINDNIISNNIYGIICWNSEPVISDNILTNNTYGVDIPYNSKYTIPKISETYVNEIDIENCFFLEKENLIIENRSFDFKYYKGSITAQGLLTFYDCDNFTVKNCELSENENGIFSYFSSGKVINNILNDNENGLHLRNSDLIILNNSILNNFRGIRCWYSNPQVTKNQISNNEDGISCWYSNPKLDNNLIFGNNYGIYLKLSNIEIYNTTIQDSNEYDVYLEENSKYISINSTYNKNNVFFNSEDSEIIVKWFLHIKVLNQLNESFQNVKVNIFDNFDIYNKNFTTDYIGMIYWLELTEFTQNSTDIFYFIPYTINVSKYWSWKNSTLNLDESKNITIILEIEKSGDWIVTGKEVYWNESIILTGNLTVKNGGNLTFYNITLVINCSFDGEFGINVESGGELYILDYDGNPQTKFDMSNITSANKEFEYKFLVNEDTIFKFQNSFLSECGYWPGENGQMGLTIKNNNSLILNSEFNNNYYGISFVNSNFNDINGNSFYDNEWSGLYLNNSQYNDIYDNIFLNNSKEGIYLFESDNNEVSNNEIHLNNHPGISLLFSINNQIFFNNITENENGISLSYSSNNHIYNNSVKSNIFYGIHVYSSSNIEFKNNSISSNGDDGIYFYSSSNNRIFNNMISDNKNGIYMYISNNNLILNSTINNSSNYDFFIDFFSRINVINSTFNISKINVTIDSKITVKYFLNVIIKRQSQIPLKNANVRILEKERDGFDEKFKTNKDGFIGWIECIYFTQIGEEIEYFTPHTIIATDNASYNSTDIIMDKFQIVILTLEELKDWIIFDHQIRKDETIILNGNLSVESGGFLEFNNVKLILNCKSDGMYSIDVKSGGSFFINDNDDNNKTIDDASIISSSNENYEFIFTIKRYSTFVMKNSEIHECGFGANDWGLIIESNDVIIDKNLISENYCGIYLDSSNALIINNTIINNNQGIYLENNSDPEIFNNLISENENSGLRSDYSKGKISNNLISNNLHGIYSFYSELKIDYNTISANKIRGIALEYSNSTISHCQISNSNIGVNSYKTTVEICNSTVEKNNFEDYFISGDSYVESINTTNERDAYIEDSSEFKVSWFLNLIIYNQVGKPENKSIVHIWDNKNGTYLKDFKTDSNGTIKDLILVEYIQDLNQKIYFTDHNIDARFGIFQYFTKLKLNESKTLKLYLEEINNWIVRFEEVWINETVILNGNLTIEDEGSLTFRNITLIMNCTMDGEYGILVKDGGKFYILDYDGNPESENDRSNITAFDKDFEYKFLVDSGSVFEMKNSELSECGYNNGENGVSYFTIKTDNILVEYSTIYNNYYGIYFSSSNFNNINNCSIYKTASKAILMHSSNNNYIDNNIIYKNYYEGIFLSGSNRNIISNNKIYNNLDDGLILYIDSNNNLISNNNIIFNSKVGIKLFSSNNNQIINNSIDNNEDGIYLYSSNNTNIKNNHILNCLRWGIYSKLSIENIVNNSIIYNTQDYDFYLLKNSFNTVINTQFDEDKLYIKDNSNIQVKYYLNFLVNDSFGNPISNALIIVKSNENDSFDKSSLTKSDGRRKWIKVTEYIQNETNKTYFTPHTITVSKGVSHNEMELNINKSRTLYITLDTIKPEIYGTNVKSTDTTATISWLTNKGSDSKVIYWLDLGKNITEFEDSYFTYHSIKLTNLTPETNYFFTIISKDIYGNTNQLKDLSFETKKETIPPAQIRNLKAVDLKIGGTIELTWDISDAEDFSRYNIYQSSNDSGNIFNMEFLKSYFSQRTYKTYVENLINDKKYYFAVTAVDLNGNENINVTSVFVIPTLQDEGINLQIKDIEFPKKAKIGEKINISFLIYNYGTEPVSNISIEVYFGETLIYKHDFIVFINERNKSLSISFNWKAIYGKEKIKIKIINIETGNEIGEVFESEYYLEAEKENKFSNIFILIFLIIGIGAVNLIFKKWLNK